MASTLPFAVALPAGECVDGVDNDGDGGTDWLGTPAGNFEDWDNECTWPGDPSEGEADEDVTCPHPSPHSHTYGAGGSVGGRSDAAQTGDFGAGLTTVTDTNAADCNGDGVAGDFDGDYESGVGGGFFGFGPWADEPVCNFGLRTHGATVVANDVVHGSNVRFVVGADDTSGPDLTPDPATGEPACTTDGSITPGDPATDPTADADDCLTAPVVGTGTTCGAGGDGGYWVFLDGAAVTETGGAPGNLLCVLPEPPLEAVNDAVNGVVGGELLPICLGNPGNVGVNNAPTSGTLTA